MKSDYSGLIFNLSLLALVGYLAVNVSLWALVALVFLRGN